MKEAKLSKVLANSIAKSNKAMSDPDRDGYASVVDCEPHNTNKQGVVDWIKAKFQKRDYEEVRSERLTKREARRDERMQVREQRHQEKMAKLRQRTEASKEQLEAQKYRSQTQGSQLNLQQRRQEMMMKRQKAMSSMGQMPSMMGGFGQISPLKSDKSPSLSTGINPFDPFGLKKPSVSPKKPQKKRKKKRRK